MDAWPPAPRTSAAASHPLPGRKLRSSSAERVLRTSDFDYDLPAGLIAQHPAAERGASRLLTLWRGSATPMIQHGWFRDLSGIIPAGDLLVLNTTRVRHSRFHATRSSGAPAEVLLLHPAPGNQWVAMGKPGSALRPGKRLAVGPDAWIETTAVLPEGYRLVRFLGLTAEAAIREFGRLPLPPYIERDPTALDESRYQTVYAEREASVAAPTAGLHFTPGQLATLEAQGVGIARIDLEIGPGTFRPVEVDDPGQHPMHPEPFEIPDAAATAIADTRKRGGSVWAVGTTVVRALESAVEGGGVRPGRSDTSLLITPGYQFRIVDRLITNFHLPRSTLLMLVSAFGGHEAVMESYRQAVAEGYRFYSYGDAMLIR